MHYTYVKEDNDSNAWVMITRVIWILMSEKVAKLNHSPPHSGPSKCCRILNYQSSLLFPRPSVTSGRRDFPSPFVKQNLGKMSGITKHFNHRHSFNCFCADNHFAVMKLMKSCLSHDHTLETERCHDANFYRNVVTGVTAICHNDDKVGVMSDRAYILCLCWFRGDIS